MKWIKTKYQSLWDAAKIAHLEKFTAVKTTIRRAKRTQILKTVSQIKYLGKEQTKPKASKR